MTCEQRRDLLLLYVSDALEASESAEMRQHLQAGCPACAGYLAEAQAVMASIPLGLDPIAPPLGLKARLMQRIDAAESSKQKTVDVGGEPLPLRLFRYLVPAAVAAGLAIVCTHLVMNQKVQTLQQQANTLREQSDKTLILQAVQDQQLKSQRQIVEMLESPHVKLVHLDHTEYQPKATANLLWDEQQKQWLILTTGMSAAGDGKTYELWFVTDKGAVAAGCFDVDSRGDGFLAVKIPSGIGELKTAAVTDEKAGGVSTPAGHFQVLAKLD